VALGLRFGLSLGFPLGLALGVVYGVAEDAELGATNPRSIVRDDLVGVVIVGLVFGLASLLATGLALGFTTKHAAVYGEGFAVEFVTVFVLGQMGGPVGGIAGLRYVALLLCTRRWSSRRLPWRLGRFLDLCYQAGLLRIAGAGYQFRHRELQDNLVCHPTA
jgi:hypothetical protein